MPPVRLSIFDLYKIGPGPSSSHTIGPMKAALDFRNRIGAVGASGNAELRASLYGSLSATGKGHGTDRALAAGFLGRTPEECDPDFFNSLFSAEDSYATTTGRLEVVFSGKNISYGEIETRYPFSNTLVLSLVQNGAVLLEQEYYSVGGGFIQWKGWSEPEIAVPTWPYASMDELKEQLGRSGLPLPELLIENERALTGASLASIEKRLDRVVMTMTKAVERGLSGEGLLPGPIRLHRKAPSMHMRAMEETRAGDRFFSFLNAYALAAAEENASGGIVVTAPTSGSAGVVPGVLYLAAKNLKSSKRQLRKALLAGAVIGFLVKHNASISGAEAGCMGEIGTASAMAAAMLAFLNRRSLKVLEAAAEIALEHHLGMTCDPVRGYVQIPCIERNAVGAVKAYNAYLLASSADAQYQKVSLDRVIAAVRETGRDMSQKYKETSLAGLAVNVVEC